MSEEFGIQAELIKGRSGVFEVTVDDHLVYSKKASGRFPEPGEVAGAIRAQLTG